jgi:DUF971 family protein
MEEIKLAPLKIKLDKKERQLFIEWNDGHNTKIDFGLLRLACPCATCRGGHENMSSEPDSKVFSSQLPNDNMSEIANMEMVGSYALSVVWGDGYQYGIYTWHYLRALCNCEKCQKLRSSK